MSQHFGWHSSVFVDTVGHCVGSFLFGFLVMLFVRERRFDIQLENRLSILAASLVFLWNVSELIVLGFANTLGIEQAYFATVVSFCSLSMLPAVLLHISLENRWKRIAVVGYTLSAAAILVQFESGVVGAGRSRLSLLLLSFGFALLSLGVWVWFELGSTEELNTPKPNRVAFLSLVIFATSFLHFQSGHTTEVWIGEAIWRHLAIPIALIVLLQNYRFLLLDVFLRFAISALAISIWLWGVALVNERFHLWSSASHSDFDRGLLLTALGFLLYLLARTLQKTQRLMTTLAFRRRSLDALFQSLQDSGGASEQELLDRTRRDVANYFNSKSSAVIKGESVWTFDQPTVIDLSRRLALGLPDWTAVLLPLRFSKGDRAWVILGARAGGRRFLSEDLSLLQRISIAIVARIERFRNEQMGQLVSQAELHTLQAQINPHFFFNALNTLYGTIGRGSPEARKLVLNLAEIFRARLQTRRMYVSLAEELDLVRAYLEIEALRLGDRLTSETIVEDQVRSIIIPVLSIQPLVENAIKHGAASSGAVVVRLTIARTGHNVTVRVEDKGTGFSQRPSEGLGVGLDNVRRRLELCYGAKADFRIESSSLGSTVSFSLPDSHDSTRTGESSGSDVPLVSMEKVVGREI